MQKQQLLQTFAFKNGLKRSQLISFFVNPTWICLVASMVLTLFLTIVLFAKEDPFYEKCISQMDTPAPWCYQEEVEKIGDPALCENIMKYWPKADGVHGHCYYQLAIKNKDCELCIQIKKKDIREMCELDACK